MPHVLNCVNDSFCRGRSASEEEMRPLLHGRNGSYEYDSFGRPRKPASPCCPLWDAMEDTWGRTQAQRGVQDPVTFTTFATQLQEQGSALEAYVDALTPFFHVLPPSERPSLQAATLQQYASPHPEPHIIITGDVFPLFPLLLPLRSRYLDRIHPIIFLYTHFPQEEWQHVNFFPKVRPLLGSLIPPLQGCP